MGITEKVVEIFSVLRLGFENLDEIVRKPWFRESFYQSCSTDKIEIKIWYLNSTYFRLQTEKLQHWKYISKYRQFKITLKIQNNM